MSFIHKIKKNGTTILPVTVSDAVLMNSEEAGNLTSYLEALQATIDMFLSWFEEDENKDIRVKGGKGLYSESFISAGGRDSSTGEITEGFNVQRMWDELRAKASSDKEIINDSHISSNIVRKSDLAKYVTEDDLMWRNVTDI